MNRVGFFTPLINQVNPTFRDRCGKAADEYFNFGTHIAYKIPTEHKGTKQVVDIVPSQPGDPLYHTMQALSMATGIIPIIMMLMKIVIRFTEKPLIVVPAEQKLNEGIEINKDLISHVQKLIPDLVARKISPSIIYTKYSDDLVFELNSHPGLIIKLSQYAQSDPELAEKEMKSRYENLLNATAITRIYSLSRTHIPHAKLCAIKEKERQYFMVIEKKLNLEECASIEPLPQNRTFVLINPKKELFHPLIMKNQVKKIDPKEEELLIFEKARKLGYGYLMALG